MPAPASYPGEDSAELHLHGGRAVLRAVTEALLQAGARLAGPGEFTKRAFLNGRMDLLEAEGVSDLVAAETEAQRVHALRQLDGAQSQELAGWAGRLRRLLAWQEALIDFPDEDLPDSVEAELLADLDALAGDLKAALRDAGRGAKLREGLVFAVTGRPNAGKSSLVNALARRDVAIVSDVPGTTRDALEVTLELAGVPVTLVDTAGLRQTDDPVERQGVQRALDRAAAADLVLHLIDVRDMTPDQPAPTSAPVIVVRSKIDLAAAADGIGISAATGEGLLALEAVLAEQAQALAVPDHPAMTRARHVDALQDAARCLFAAREAGLPELRGEELRLAMRAIGRITGEVDVEAVLDTVFGAFCIGK
jgi:tRNA modification GTPase